MAVQPAQRPHERIAGLKRRAEAGPQILQYAFRPFFLLAALWAAIAVPLWVARFAGLPTLPAGIDPLWWHTHEMLFGFVAASVAGFILTAVPNWTGNLPVSGWRLALLVLAWFAGRVAMLAGAEIGAAAVAILDLVFPAALCTVIGRELLGSKARHNYPPFLLIVGFSLGNLLTHLERIGLAATGDFGIRLAILMIALLMALIGGRVVPSFTRNWLAKRGRAVLPVPFNGFDKLALAVLVLFVVAALLLPRGPATGVIGLAAGALHLVRLARWRGYLVLGEPLLWVLHLGYLWLAVGVALYGAAALGLGVTQSTALHALTTGAFGTMILAVASRAALGHTGRPLTAGPGDAALLSGGERGGPRPHCRAVFPGPADHRPDRRRGRLVGRLRRVRDTLFPGVHGSSPAGITGGNLTVSVNTGACLGSNASSFGPSDSNPTTGLWGRRICPAVAP